MGNNIPWYFSAPACCHVNHDIVKPAVAAKFLSCFICDAEFYAAAFFIDGFYARFYDKIIANGEGAFIINMGGTYYPAKAAFHKFFHCHAVAAFHLVITGGKHVIKVFAVVYMPEHINIIRANAEFGFEGRVGG